MTIVFTIFIKVASMVSVSDHLSSLLWRQAVRVAINTFVEVVNMME